MTRLKSCYITEGLGFRLGLELEIIFEKGKTRYMWEEWEFGLSSEFHFIRDIFHDGAWKICIVITRTSTEPQMHLEHAVRVMRLGERAEDRLRPSLVQC